MGKDPGTEKRRWLGLVCKEREESINYTVLRSGEKVIKFQFWNETGISSHYVHTLPAPLVPAGTFPGFCLAPPPNTSKNQTHSKGGPRVQPSTLIYAGGLQGFSPGGGGREDSLPNAFSKDLSPPL